MFGTSFGLRVAGMALRLLVYWEKVLFFSAWVVWGFHKLCCKARGVFDPEGEVELCLLWPALSFWLN